MSEKQEPVVWLESGPGQGALHAVLKTWHASIKISWYIVEIWRHGTYLYPQGRTVSSSCNRGRKVHMIYTDKCQYCDPPQRSLIISLEINVQLVVDNMHMTYVAIPGWELRGLFGRTCLCHRCLRMSPHVYALYDLFKRQFLLNGNQCPIGSKLSMRKARGGPR